MAAGFARVIGDGRIDVYSGGSEPADHVNPMAVDAMREVGIDIAGFTPQKFTDELLHRVDVVVTMGCGDTCPFIPGTRYLDWDLPDPKGQEVDAVRATRDEIDRRVRELVVALDAAG